MGNANTYPAAFVIIDRDRDQVPAPGLRHGDPVALRGIGHALSFVQIVFARLAHNEAMTRPDLSQSYSQAAPAKPFLFDRKAAKL